MEKQEHGYGCGLYAISNVLGVKDYVTPERLELSKKGVHLGNLNKYMEEDGIGFFVDVLYCDTYQDKLPEKWIELKIEGEDVTYMPLLVQVVISDKFHLIGAKLFKSGELEIFDSLAQEPIYRTLEKVNEMYEKVVGLYSFNHFKDGEYVFF